jgi:hypothetical protein
MGVNPSEMAKLRNILGEENLFESKEKRIAYASDASKATGKLPDAVARPKSAEQVSRIMKLASEHGIPIYPRGAGSGLTGGAVPLQGGIVLEIETQPLDETGVEFDKIQVIVLAQPWHDASCDDTGARPNFENPLRPLALRPLAHIASQCTAQPRPAWQNGPRSVEVANKLPEKQSVSGTQAGHPQSPLKYITTTIAMISIAYQIRCELNTGRGSCRAAVGYGL